MKKEMFLLLSVFLLLVFVDAESKKVKQFYIDNKPVSLLSPQSMKQMLKHGKTLLPNNMKVLYPSFIRHNQFFGEKEHYNSCTSEKNSRNMVSPIVTNCWKGNRQVLCCQHCGSCGGSSHKHSKCHLKRLSIITNCPEGNKSVLCCTYCGMCGQQKHKHCGKRCLVNNDARNIEYLKALLANGYVINYYLWVVDKNWVSTMPMQTSNKQQYLGGCTFLLIGYDQVTRCFFAKKNIEGNTRVIFLSYDYLRHYGYQAYYFKMTTNTNTHSRWRCNKTCPFNNCSGKCQLQADHSGWAHCCSNNPLHKWRAKKGKRWRFQAYAAPNFYGPWVDIAAHFGQTSYRITYHALGNTQVYGQVKYYNDNGENIETLYSGKKIYVSGAATVYARFKGIPFGSKVEGEAK